MRRVVPLVFDAKFPHALVITLGEHCPPGLRLPVITAITGRESPRLASTSPIPFSSRQNSRNCSRPGPVSRISYQPPIEPCMASHLPPPENRRGAAAATASSTAVNCASMVPGQPSRNSSAGTVLRGCPVHRALVQSGRLPDGGIPLSAFGAESCRPSWGRW
jgi:hypothetical protein